MKETINDFMKAYGLFSEAVEDENELISILKTMTEARLNENAKEGVERFWYVSFISINGSSQGAGVTILNIHPVSWMRKMNSSGVRILSPNNPETVILQFFKEIPKEVAIDFGWKETPDTKQ